MKNLSKKPFIFTFTVLLTILAIFSDVAYAGRGGRGGGARGGGGARTSSVNRSSGARGGGASQRVNSSTSLQNRGNFSNSSSRQGNQGQRQTNRSDAQGNRQTNQGERQTNRSDAQGDRQTNQGERQTNRSNAQGDRQDNRQTNQGNRQDNAGNRQDNRQNNAGNRQDNRQDFVNDNWRGGGWYGGGYYAPPGWGAWTAAVGLTAGLAIGASVATPPPYYDTIYIGSTSYIYSDGVYMQPSNGNYVIISPPVGAVVSYLPDGCTVTQMGNTQYYDCAGIYYQTFYQNGTTVYKVIQI
ncbi:DUF6515 family protein [Geminocystis herdmanii]|uniref:DUF6515 family protein n=1 Tax=Geminocystis herdmanii TaxID=669359 RepID=UPI00034612EE|nr:DUF6515 family protein [Geminocystis herdmanii]